MTCPNWNHLVTERDAAGGQRPEGWNEAVAHLDGCQDCRRDALRADPTLVFRRLPAVATTQADVASMRRAVASLRRAHEVEEMHAPAEASLEPVADRRPSRRLRHAAAAVAVVAAGFGVWLAPSPDDAERAAVDAVEPPPAVVTAGSEAAPAAVPVLDGLSQPQTADVYQMEGEEDLVVVMMVDETLDI